MQGQGHVAKLLQGAISLQQAQWMGPEAEGAAAVLGEARQVSRTCYQPQPGIWLLLCHAV